jgi:hypothetical protein
MICGITLRRFAAHGALALIVACGWTSIGSAYFITLTGGSSGGNPGGQPIYEVSGLVQGDQFDLSWGGIDGVDASGTVTIAALTGTTADIHVALENLSTPISGNDPRLTSVGFLIDGFTSLASAMTGATYLTNAKHSSFPGFQTLPCATSGNNCAGGGNGGVPAGLSDAFTLKVNGTFSGELALSDFALKVQGGPGGDSFELAGVPAPEPTAAGLLLLAVVGLALRRRPI